MSKSEDYLDGLLESMERKKEEPEFAEPERKPEDDFLDAFEKEFLSGDNEDDFIRQFERELDAEQDEQKDTMGSSDSMFFDNLDGIVNSVKEKMQDSDLLGESDDTAFSSNAGNLMVDTIGDMGGNDFSLPEENLPLGEDFSMDNAASPETMEDTAGDFGFDDFGGMTEDLGFSMDETESLVENMSGSMGGPSDMGEDDNLMNLLQSEGDFSDIGDLLQSDEDKSASEENASDGLGEFSFDGFDMDAVMDASIPEEDAAKEEPDGKKKRKKQKSKQAANGEKGFFQKMSEFLFGVDEDEGAENSTEESAAVKDISMDDMSDENLQILQALEGSGASAVLESVPEKTEDPKEKKKREKKEKKEQEKAEKKIKQEQAKKAREQKRAQKQSEKKQKAPKEKDLTPPLPKKPVILIFLMAASFLALVLLGTNLFGYSNSMATAANEFALGNYEAAFREVEGLELKDEDIALYGKYRAMANVAGEYSAYQSFMEARIYDLALDCLVRTVGRCEKYSGEAAEYGCAGELQKLREQVVGTLGSFGLTEERALALYAEDDRATYSTQLYDILETAGLDVE